MNELSQFAALDPPSEQRNVRFFDNRQKYLLFVNTCNEKQVVANRVSAELAAIAPNGPAFRLFDAGIGDGTVLARVMRAAHARFPAIPHFVVGKEISPVDVRITLEKLTDRFVEHPQTVLVLSNMFFSEAPWLRPSPSAAGKLVRHDVALEGATSSAFEAQIAALDEFITANWKAAAGKTGNPVYEKPVILAIYRKDRRAALDEFIPRAGLEAQGYDLVIASQPYRLRVSAERKARNVIAPLSRALAPGGRLIGIHSHGDDPGFAIIQAIWPGEDSFAVGRHAIVSAVKEILGAAGGDLTFDPMTDDRSIFRYRMHTLENEFAGPLGTSALFAAWNAATYVAQIDDERVDEASQDPRHLAVTRDVLRRHGGLWFNNESYVISRRH